MSEDRWAPATRVIVRREPLVEKTCPHCGDAFLGLARQVYCTPAHRAAAEYRRHQEERKARRRGRYRELQGRLGQTESR